MPETKPQTTTAAPQVSTYQMTPYQRALGRMVSLDVFGNDPTQVEKDLAGDLFWSYFTNLKAKEETPAGREINRRLIDWVQEGQTYQQSRETTMGNLFTSAVSAGALQYQLLNDPSVKEAIEKQIEAEKAAAEAEAAEAMAKAQEAAGNAQQAAAQRNAAQKARAAAAAANAAGNAKLDGLLGGPVGQALRAKATKAAAEQAKDAEEFATGWGMEPGNAQDIDLKAIQQALKNDAGKIARITRLMGRAKGVGRKQQARKTHQTTQTWEDGYTQKLTNIFPSELALIRPDAPAMIRATKMGEYADRGLLGKVQAAEEKENGPIVFMVDGSGSMNGEREINAKAIALGMAQAAEENGQDYKMATFSTGHEPFIEVNSSQDWQAHIAWATRMQGGGTDFDQAMERAVELVNEYGAQAKKADIVFITDGESDISTQTMAVYEELRERLGTRLVMIAVGNEDDSGYSENLRMVTTRRLFFQDGGDFEKIAQDLAETLW